MSWKIDNVLNILFDISFLLYIVAYVYYYDNAIANSEMIRMVATLAMLTTGSLEVLKNNKLVGLNSYILSYMLFMAFCLLSSIWAYDSHLATRSFPVMLRIVILFVFLNYRIINDTDIERLLDIFLIAVIIIIFIVAGDMIEYYDRNTFLLYRFGIVGNNPNTIAMLSSFGIIICNHKCKIGRNKKQYTVLFIFFMLVILVTQSKKGILALALGLFLISYLRNKGNKRINKVFYLGIILLTLYILLMIVPFLHNNIGYRFDELLDFFGKNPIGSNSTTKRAKLILQGFNIWLHYPLLGIGINNFALAQSVYPNTYYYSHCNYIELLSGVGLIGFCLYYAFPFKCIRTRIDIKDDIRIALKTICLLILFFDIASVNFQEVYFLIFYTIFFISINRKKSNLKAINCNTCGV